MDTTSEMLLAQNGVNGLADLTPELLQEITHRIVDTIQPDKIILFGSRARDQASPDSDMDLLVIAPSSQPRWQRAVPLYGVLSDILLPMDILVYTKEEVDEWRSVPQAFITTATHEGRVLYEKPD
jgi:predicted nucleotidyltransferase